MVVTCQVVLTLAAIHLIEVSTNVLCLYQDSVVWFFIYGIMWNLDIFINKIRFICFLFFGLEEIIIL